MSEKVNVQGRSVLNVQKQKKQSQTKEDRIQEGTLLKTDVAATVIDQAGEEGIGET